MTKSRSRSAVGTSGSTGGIAWRAGGGYVKGVWNGAGGLGRKPGVGGP